jgi:MFS transporter, DHA3 family, macrolide efflux protein
LRDDLSQEEIRNLSSALLRNSINAVKSISNNPIEFYDLASFELFQREIAVFTPKMDIFLLPEGSTVLDFAFIVNPSLAKRMSFASLVSQIKNGFSYFWDNKLIFWSVFLITLANIAVVGYNVNMVNLVQNELQLSSNVYGLVLTFYSSGSFYNVFNIEYLKFNRIRGYIYILSLMVGGLLYICILFVNNAIAILLCIVFFLLGFSFACASTISTTILFEIPSEEFRGRVLGIASISSLLSPLGFLIWGAVGSIVSSSIAMSLAGVAIVIVAIIGFKTPIIKYR